MSFFGANGTDLVRELWPTPVAAALEDGSNRETLPAWRVVPESYDELCSWAVVVPDEIDKGNSLAVYSPDVYPSEDLMKVSLVMHGVVQAVNLKPLGNWNGRRESAGRALQYITLGPGRWNEVFAMQLETLAHMKTFLGDVLRDHIHDAARSADTIYCHRPVFSRARSADGRTVKSMLRVGDDPHGHAAAIQSEWVVSHRVLTGKREQGQSVRKPSSIIRPGDFVQVAANIEIVKAKVNKQWRRTLRLAVTEVVRTHTAFELEVLTGKEDEEEGQADATTRVPKTMSVFGLEDEYEGEEGDEDRMDEASSSQT